MNDVSFITYEARCAAAVRLRKESLPQNKRVLFDALLAAGIATVTISFDGYGDEGKVGPLEAFDAQNNNATLPIASLTMIEIDFDASATRRVETTISDFLQEIAYDLLRDTYRGWEDNEGAYGEFRFDVAGRTITLEYNERTITTHYREYQF